MIDRDAAARLGIQPQAVDSTLYDAFGQRQVSIIYKRYNQYHVVLEVDPRVPTIARLARQDLREVSHGKSGAAERDRAFRNRPTRLSPSTTRGSSRASRFRSTSRPAFR